MLDTGSGTSIIDLGTLKKIGLDSEIDNSSLKTLINASGEKMKILGAVTLNVQISNLPPRKHVFQVLDSINYTNILLGRDFMRLFGSVKFDFAQNKIQLGPTSISCLSTQNASVRLCEDTTIPARSEKVLSVESTTDNFMLTGDFEPNRLPKSRGLYITRSRVVPNIDGIFCITALNVSSCDVVLKSQTTMGTLQPAGETISSANIESRASSFKIDDVDINSKLSAQEKSQLEQLLMDYQDVFAANTKKPQQTPLVKHRIITNDALPVNRKQHRVPVAWQDDLKQQVSEMLSNGIIRPSASPWNAPVLLVKKKDNSIRFVCDFRGVNDVTKRDTYPLPHIKDVIDKMAGARYWSTLDAASAYWSIPLVESDKEKTAFSSPNGKFEFNVMPFGLSNAGASYQRMMDMCLAGLPSDRTLAYMDDIVVFNSTFEQHIQDLATVFDRLRSAKVSLKASKCVFASEKVNFLGYELSFEGIQPQQRLTEAISNFPPPTTRKELKSFLGLAGFYRAFIRNFATITQPLNRLTSDNVQFAWSESCESAFCEIKRRLTSQPILAFPKLNETFIIEVDASDFAAGGVLSQKGSDGLLHSIAYFSTAFKSSQRNWATITKEAFALILAIRHWHVYLSGTPFVLNSDHNPLVHLRQQKDPRGKFARWIAELEEYDYTVQYIRGKTNIKADLLSRNKNASSTQPNSLFDDKIYAAFFSDISFKEQLLEEQQSDPVINSVKHAVENKTRILQGRFKRIQNKLRIENGVLTKSGRPVIPASLRKFVIAEVHNTAHFGTDKCYAILKDRFFWPSMYGYVKNFISLCVHCQQTKCNTAPPKAPLVDMVTPDAPMQFICIDIAYMPKDNKGFEYFLLIGDIFSKYIEAVPLKDQTTSSIIAALLSKWIYIHGIPLYILSDQGSNIDSQALHELCNIFGIEKRRSSAYHSQGNGFAERNIRSVKDMLRSALLHRSLNQSKWSTILPELIFALNTSVSKAINHVPFDIVFGRSARLPIDVLFATADHTPMDSNTPTEYANDRNQTIKTAYDVVIDNLQLSRSNMQKQYNKNIRFNDFPQGAKVWLKVKYYKTGENRKLAPRRRGPWTVLQKLPNGVNFKIENDQTKETKTVHHDRLTPVAMDKNTDRPVQDVMFHDRSFRQDDILDRFASKTNDSESDEERVYTSSDEDYTTDTDNEEFHDDNERPYRRYNLRERRARHFPENIPWTAIQL